MLYGEFIKKAMDAAIVKADNGSFYLEPTWTVILLENNLDPKNVSDYETNWPALNDVLKLEVEKRNTINSKKNFVIEWLYELIVNQIDPVMLDEETEYLKALTEYMQAKSQSESSEIKPEELKDEDWNNFKNS